MQDHLYQLSEGPAVKDDLSQAVGCPVMAREPFQVNVLVGSRSNGVQQCIAGAGLRFQVASVDLVHGSSCNVTYSPNRWTNWDRR